MTTSKSKEAVCCPRFNPKPYDKKTFVWKNKLFIKDNVKQIFHFPLNMGKVVTRMWKKIENSSAAPKTKDFLMLAYDPNQWVSEIYMTVTKSVPDAENVRISGTFASMVFDGQYNEVPKWIAEMDAYLASKKKKAKKYYFYYTTCPKCAKKYGHNYVVAFAEL